MFTLLCLIFDADGAFVAAPFVAPATFFVVSALAFFRRFDGRELVLAYANSDGLFMGSTADNRACALAPFPADALLDARVERRRPDMVVSARCSLSLWQCGSA